MSYQLASEEAIRSPAADDDGSSELGLQSIVGDSPPLNRAIGLARKVASRRITTVLLTGETGTGKELFARGIHYASPTQGEPFVAVNCAAIPETLLESELFGHERGAFTDARSQKRGLLELAGSGTLFLDEVGDLPPNLQPKLLRVLEERKVRRLGGVDEVEVECRIVAASDPSLDEAVADGTFREDLFYRLNVFRVGLPPLAERGDDVEALARHFLEELAEDQGFDSVELTPDALAALRAHDWPGNVRELKNVIERAAIMAEGGPIRARHLRIQRRDDRPPAAEAPSDAHYRITIPEEGRTLDEIEAEALRITLELAGGNRSQAARMLGVSRPTVYRKIEKYGIRVPGDGPATDRQGE